MASSGSDISDRVAATGSLGSLSLSNPELANLPAAELVVHLYNNRRGSDFADVAVVLAERERRLAEAEAGEREARLQAEARAWERRATEADAPLLRTDVRRPDRTVASVGDQEGVEAQLVGAHASRRAGEVEVAPLDCTPSAVEAAAGVLVMLAEAAADLPRLSPLRTTAADALLAPALQRESECNKENEDSGNSCHGHPTVSQGNVCIDKGKGQAKEDYFTDAASVASEDSDDDDWTKHLTESQFWEVFNTLKAQVSAWESELNTTDGGMPTRTAHEGKIVDESEAHVRSEATEARLQDEIVMCERKLLEASKTEERLCAEIMVCKERANATEVHLWAEIQARGSAIPYLEAWKSCTEEAQRQILAASKIVERLRAEMMECKERANEAEVRLWAEIQARGSAVTDLEVWKNRAEEAQRQVRAASMTEARLRDEIAACKRKATQTEASHRAEVKACEDKAAAAITGLQDEMNKRDQLANEFKAHMEDKIVALDGYHTAIQNGLRITIQALEVTFQYLSGSGPSLSDE